MILLQPNLKSLLVILLQLFSQNLIAKELTLLVPNQTIYPATIDVFEDKNHQIKHFSEIKDWKEVKSAGFFLGYTDSYLWAKGDFVIQDQNDYLLYIENAGLNHVKIWVLDEQNKQIKEVICGDEISPDRLEVRHNYPTVNLSHLPQGKYKYVLWANSKKDFSINIRFSEIKKFYENAQSNRMIWGFYVGFLLLIALFNLLLYFSTKDLANLYYALYIMSFGCFQLAIYGFFYQYVWGNIAFNYYGFIIFLALGNLSLVQYIDKFINPTFQMPYWQIAFKTSTITLSILSYGR